MPDVRFPPSENVIVVWRTEDGWKARIGPGIDGERVIETATHYEVDNAIREIGILIWMESWEFDEKYQPD